MWIFTFVLCGLARAQDIWSDIAGVVGPGNTSQGVPINYWLPSVPGSANWTLVPNSWTNSVEGSGWTTSSGVGCANAYKVGNITVGSVAELPSSDRAVFVGFWCVNEPACTLYPTLGDAANKGMCSMTRFLKIKQVAQGADAIGSLIQITVGPGTWGTNVTAGGSYNCPPGQFMTNMRCWRGPTSGGGCANRQIECASFVNPMFRLAPLQVVFGPFSNTGTIIPSPSQGSWMQSATAIVGISTTNQPSISFVAAAIEMKSCSVGYELVGGMCVGKTCPPLGPPLNGNVVFTPSVATPIYPASAYFTCNPGYSTAQTQNTQCQPNAGGTMYWTNPVITCTGVPCAPLSNPSNGLVTTSNFNVYPSTANYSCSAGFIGTYSTAICAPSAFWVPSLPAVCIGVPCASDTTFYVANNGSVYPTVVGAMRYPSTATYTCQPGYGFTDSSQRICTTNGSWFPVSPPICLGVPCPQQSSILNGNVTQTSLRYPSSAIYACLPGFQLVGGSSVRPCGTDGVFVGSPPSCNRIPCVAPNASVLVALNINVNATTGTNGFLFPSIVTYECQKGFYPTGSLTASCTTAGIYPPPLSCVGRHINSGSLLINNQSTKIFPATNVVADIFFNGSLGLTSPTGITYGPVSNPSAFSCGAITYNISVQSVRCVVGAGVGANLTIAVILSDPPGAIVYFPNFMSFPVPMIRNGTLRAVGGTGVGNVVSNSASGDSLSFQCDHCGTVAGQLTIAFGAPLPFGANCGSITVTTAFGDTQNVTCALQSGAGGPHIFYLNVAGLTFTSVDTYKYPVGPVIYNVSGCPTIAGAGTSQCPCSGKLNGTQVVLTVSGVLFDLGTPVSVQIGQKAYPVLSSSANQITANLPPGVGSQVGVQITAGALQSQVVFSVGYAAPKISNVSGCTGATLCSRAGGDVVTITGSNFGNGVPAPLVVLIGTFPCANVNHDFLLPDARVTCTMTPGEGLHLGVFAIQPNGLIGSFSGVEFSYEECAPGTYDNTTGLNCVPCDNGTFSAVSSQSACSKCGVGTFGPSRGLSACLDANQGYYVNATGSVARYPCTPGYFTDRTQSISCQPCDAGTYAPSPASLACSACPVGKAIGSFAATDCANCIAGTFSVKQGQTACELCLPGWAAPLPSAVSCTQCSLGKFSNQGVNCSICDAGTFQNQAGSTVCIQCDPGRFSNTTLATTCVSCEQGKFQGFYGQSNCTLCPLGTSSFQFGAISCALCVQGAQQNLTGQLSCSDCPAGKQALLPGSSVCDDCLPGKFASAPRTVACSDCLASTATNQTGQMSCPQCAPGKFVDVTGQLVCSDCAVGFFASERGSFRCSFCSAGSFSNSTGSTICQACSPGKFANLRSLTVCDSCGVGFYSGADGATTCAQCAPGSITLGSSARECVSCPPGATPAGSECICIPSYSWTGATCERCVTGQDCNKYGAKLSEAVPLPGFWQVGQAVMFQACLVSTYCPGGGVLCAPFREGPLCQSCVDGYRMLSGSTDGSCAECSDSGVSAGNILGVGLACVVVLVLLYYVAVRNGLRYFQDSAETARRQWWDSMAVTADMITSDKNIIAATEQRVEKTMVFQRKILITFIQLTTSCIPLSTLSMPPSFRSFLEAIDIVNLNFIPWAQVGCIGSYSLLTKILVTALVPFMLLPLCASLLVVVLKCLDWRAAKAFPTAPNVGHNLKQASVARKTRARYLAVFWKVTLFTVFLVYPAVSRQIFAYFRCVEVYQPQPPSIYLLRESFREECYDAQWRNNLPVIVLLLFVYPIGVPVVLGFVLCRYRPRFHEGYIRYTLGFVYEGYTAKLWFWELVDLVHKFLVSSVVSLLPGEAQLPTMLVFLGLYLSLLLIGEPYVRQQDNHFHFLTQVALYLIVYSFLARGSIGPIPLGSDEDLLLSILLLVITLLVAVKFVIHLVAFARRVRFGK